MKQSWMHEQATVLSFAKCTIWSLPLPDLFNGNRYQSGSFQPQKSSLFHAFRQLSCSRPRSSQINPNNNLVEALCFLLWFELILQVSFSYVCFRLSLLLRPQIRRPELLWRERARADAPRRACRSTELFDLRQELLLGQIIVKSHRKFPFENHWLPLWILW